MLKVVPFALGRVNDLLIATLIRLLVPLDAWKVLRLQRQEERAQELVFALVA